MVAMIKQGKNIHLGFEDNTDYLHYHATLYERMLHHLGISKPPKMKSRISGPQSYFPETQFDDISLITLGHAVIKRRVDLKRVIGFLDFDVLDYSNHCFTKEIVDKLNNISSKCVFEFIYSKRRISI